MDQFYVVIARQPPRPRISRRAGTCQAQAGKRISPASRSQRNSRSARAPSRVAIPAHQPPRWNAKAAAPE